MSDDNDELADAINEAMPANVLNEDLSIWVRKEMELLAARLASAHLTHPPGDTAGPAEVLAGKITEWIREMDAVMRSMIYHGQPGDLGGLDGPMPDDELARKIASTVLHEFRERYGDGEAGSSPP